MLLKQKTPDEDVKAPKPGDIKNDEAAKDAASKGKDVLEKLKAADKKKAGHYESCCGAKVWVPD